jgi:hypothetical protein
VLHEELSKCLVESYLVGWIGLSELPQSPCNRAFMLEVAAQSLETRPPSLWRDPIQGKPELEPGLVVVAHASALSRKLPR